MVFAILNPERRRKADIYRASVRCLQAGDYDNAIRYCNQMLDGDFFPYVAYFNRSLARANKGNLEAAVSDITQSIESPKPAKHILAMAHANRGHFERQQGNYEASISDCGKAIELARQRFSGYQHVLAMAYMNRGLSNSAAGNQDQALSDCEQAITYATGFPARTQSLAFADRGAVYGAMQQYDRSMADFGLALELAGGQAYSKAWAYWQRALVRAGRGDHDGAIEDSTAAIEAIPQLAALYQTRGDSYKAKGDTDHANADYQKIVELRPDPVGPIDAEEAARFKQSSGNQTRRLLITITVIVILLMLSVIILH